MIARRALILSCPALVALAQEDARVRGPVRPRRLAALAPQAEGVVRTVDVAEGARVTRGEVLLRLADDVQAARIGLSRASAEAEGELRAAQVALTEAQAVLARTQGAHHLHHPSSCFPEAQAVLARTQGAFAARAAGEWEVRQARARVDGARAALETAEDRQRVEQRRLELELATAELLVLRAPFDGTITRLDVVPGMLLTRADRPVTLADLRELEAVLYLPAAAWRRLVPGSEHRLTLSAPVERAVPARLRHTDPVMDVASGRFRAVFEIDNADLSLPAGLEAELDLAAVGP